ncbi:hypothetical protein [Ruegeria sp.]|uniref:hypothetical protein n=1 Tax=Ruegeria sp. TaxID=1879320 RepID=UPI00232441F0|nr:hypothetical protein [Ruegeria sp.]MDA7963540.1 hypothetical protein [Ruegeria sp.]
MRYILFIFAIFCGLLFHPVFAQTQTPLETARSLDACGGERIIRARRKNDGSLKVVCDRKRRAAKTPPNVTPGATNVVGLLIPALGIGAAVAAAAGASSSPSSTSSTGGN